MSFPREAHFFNSTDPTPVPLSNGQIYPTPHDSWRFADSLAGRVVGTSVLLTFLCLTCPSSLGSFLTELYQPPDKRGAFRLLTCLTGAQTLET